MTDKKEPLEEETTPSGCLWQLLLFVPVVGYCCFANGFVLAKLWLWHAVPLGAPPIHWHVFAAATAAYLTIRASAKGHRDDRSSLDQAAAMVFALAMPWTALLIGWWFR